MSIFITINYVRKLLTARLQLITSVQRNRWLIASRRLSVTIILSGSEPWLVFTERLNTQGTQPLLEEEEEALKDLIEGGEAGFPELGL